MTNLESHLGTILFFTVLLSQFAVLNANADIAPDVDMHRNREERSTYDYPKETFRSDLDDILGIKYGYDDDDDEDDSFSDEGFFEEDDNDEDDSDIIEQNNKGSGLLPRDHKKNEIHRRSEQALEHAQQPQSADEETGSNEKEDSGSISGSGSGDAEVKSQETSFASQHISERKENEDDKHDKTANNVTNVNEVEEGEKQKGKQKKDADTRLGSPSDTLNKQSKNLIKLVVKGSKQLEQEKEDLSQKDADYKETSGQDAGSSSNVNLERNAEENVDLSEKEGVKENETQLLKVNDQKSDVVASANKKGTTNKSNEKIGTGESKASQLQDSSRNNMKIDKAKGKGTRKDHAKHKLKAQNTQPQKTTAKKDPTRTPKLSPHMVARKKLFSQAHVVGQAKVAHKKPVSPAVHPTCQSDSILAGHSLRGGTRAGRFSSLGETANIHACLQRCCSKRTCDVALLIDGRCYGVACFSKELCEAVQVPHPHFVFSQLGFLNKGQKRGDIQRNQEFHCQYGNLSLRNNENWSGELCGGVVRCKDGITTVTKCPNIPPKPDDCAKPRLIVKHQKGKCCRMKWKCKARHCLFNNRRIKHGYKLSDPLCTGILSCYNGKLSMEYCPKIPEKPKDCARPKLKTINVPGKCCKKVWVCSDKSCTYDGLKLSHGEKLTDASCAIVMECKNGFLQNKQCPNAPSVPHKCINPTLKVKRIPGECCEMNWTCEMS